MRKALGYICCILMLAADAAAGYYSYRAYVQAISYHQGIYTFMPLFIIAYWFNTFFSQLMSPAGGLLINKKLFNALNRIQTIINLGLIGFWAYLIVSRSLYTSM